MNRASLTVYILFIFLATAYSQETASVSGVVRDSLKQAIPLVNVSLLGTQTGTMTDENGNYHLEVPTEKTYTLVFSCIGYRSQQFALKLEQGENKTWNAVLSTDVNTLQEVSVSARQERATNFTRIDLENLNYVPSTGGKVEAIIKSQAGVSSNNELSSQYSVRGGNYDENLVYVNDMEIYRPFLMRSGQQEGLSFINSDLVSSVKFSAGGFSAKYGDRMSSALDISYKSPSEFKGSAMVSLLGASAHVEGSSKGQRFTYLAGYRYKTTSYLLNSMDTKGDYKPQFSDFQALITYHFSRKINLQLLGNYNSSIYRFVPSVRDVKFGTKDIPLNLKIYYDGQEIDRFDTYLGAFSLNIRPNKELNLKFTGSAFRTSEEETFDIQGQYWINELDNTVGSDTYGDSILNIGVGTMIDHARNYLDAYVFSGTHHGSYITEEQQVRWGLKYQHQEFYDWISEWSMLDSAGYSMPFSDTTVSIYNFIRSNNQIAYNDVSAYLMDTWELNRDNAVYYISAGIRASYWGFNPSFYLSPRTTISVQPDWEKDMMFHISWGYYYQPPFYKEMRRPDGSVNYDIKPQRSVHLLLGGDYLFSAWNRPFKFTAEFYYKWLRDLIPYKIDNIRIEYAGENISNGYTVGADFKINGEFVPGAESWMTLSLLRTREDISGDSILVETDNGTELVEAGYFPRPTDQLFTFGLFFQDYLPNNPDYKVHLNAFYGSGIPISNPVEGSYYISNKTRMRAYRRIDIGFSKVLKREYDQLKPGNPLRFFDNIWLSGEIFNLLNIENDASYSWIRTLSDQEGVPAIYGVTNKLTGRRFNIRITAKF